MVFLPGRKTFRILAVVVLGSIATAPNAFAATVPGMHLVVQVDRQDVNDRRLAGIRDEVGALLTAAKVAYSELSVKGEAVQARVAAGDAAAAKAALRPLLTGIELTEPEAGLLRLALTAEGAAQSLDQAATRSVEVIGRRIRELKLQAPRVERQGDDRILIQVPGLKDSTRLKEVLANAGRLTLQFVDGTMPAEQALAGQPPAGSVVLYTADKLPYLVETRVIVNGDQIADAQAGIDRYANIPVVTFTFDAEGTATFGKATQENVGRQLAIVLDDRVMSAPVIREPILGGSGQISGDFTYETAQDLALMLRAGSLPARLTIVEERANEPVEEQGAKN